MPSVLEDSDGDLGGWIRGDELIPHSLQEALVEAEVDDALWTHRDEPEELGLDRLVVDQSADLQLGPVS